jgi:hypothetical protein
MIFVITMTVVFPIFILCGLALEKYPKQIAAFFAPVIVCVFWLFGIALVLGICWGGIALIHLAWRNS